MKCKWTISGNEKLEDRWSCEIENGIHKGSCKVDNWTTNINGNGKLGRQMDLEIQEE